MAVYTSDKVYHQTTEIDFSEVLDDKEGVNVYYFYVKDGSNTGSIDSRIRDFYNESQNYEVDFYRVNMELEQNMEYVSDYPMVVGANPYPDVSDIKTPDDIFISQIPSFMYTVDGEVKGFKEGAAFSIDLLNEVLELIESDLVLDNK